MVAVVSNNLRRRPLFPEATKIKSGRKPVPDVMVRCPQTGAGIPTGIVTDRESFEATPVFFGRVYCPICRIEHEWFAKEAWLRELDAERNVSTAP
jgi:hypothetical protein